MTKWEYCKIIKFSTTAHDVVEEAQDSIIFLAPTGIDNPIASIDSVGKALADLGLDEWELVSHTQVIEYAGNLVPIMEQFHLKRPIQD